MNISFNTRAQKIKAGIILFSVVFFIAVSLVPLNRYFTTRAHADIAAPALYPCPASVYGWGQTLQLYIYPATNLPNGHPYCGYYLMNGDPYYGAFDRVLGTVVSFYTIVTPTSFGGYDTVTFTGFTGGSSLGPLLEIVGSTGSKCTSAGWGQESYYIQRDCASQHACVASVSSLQAVGVSSFGSAQIVSGYVNPYNLCYGWASGFLTIPGLSSEPPPYDPGG